MTDKKIFVSLKFDPPMFKQIEDFRFEHRFPTRTAAIMWLLKAALDKGLHPKVEERKS